MPRDGVAQDRERDVTRVLVTISRTWRQWSTVRGVLEQLARADLSTILVHGAAPKGDQTVAAMWRQLGGVDEPWPAEWEQFGKRAGPLRNAKMVESNPDVVFAFIRNNSNGASHTADLAEGAGLRVIRYIDNDQES